MCDWHQKTFSFCSTDASTAPVLQLLYIYCLHYKDNVCISLSISFCSPIKKFHMFLWMFVSINFPHIFSLDVYFTFKYKHILNRNLDNIKRNQYHRKYKFASWKLDISHLLLGNSEVILTPKFLSWNSHKHVGGRTIAAVTGILY